MHKAAKTQSNLWKIERVASAENENDGREVWVSPAKVIRASVWIAAGRF